jgi:3-isopropylmalate/(R)-2-methylmalate dehydratase small subunit
MQPFTSLTALAASLPMINVDTDMIIPKQFLRTIKRTGLGANLFDEMRFNADGSKIEDFVLNNAPYDKAQILVSGDNFGCGSSREHAPWALLDFGFRCIIAPSFADIFYNNCFKNGILPVTLDQESVDEITYEITQNKGQEIAVDLDKQLITVNENIYPFKIDEFRKHCLMNGLDDIGLTLEKSAHIDTFEKSVSEVRPWLTKKAG